MKLLTKTQLKTVRKLANEYLNRCHEVTVEETVREDSIWTAETAPHDIRFHIGDDHGNVCHSRNLDGLLQALKMAGVVSPRVTVMWFGMENSGLTIWCSR